MVEYTYDALHRRTRSTDPLGQVTTYSYDAVGNLLTETGPDPDGGGPLAAPVTSFSYDRRDRQLRRTDPLGHTVSYAYDLAGNRTQETDPLLRTTTSGYDAQDRVVQVTQPDPDGAGPRTSPVTASSHDLAGRLASVTDPVGNRVRYAYDAAGRLTEVTDALELSTTYTYDSAGQLLQVTDRNGRHRSFSYDLAGRRTSEAWLDGWGSPQHTVTSSYDAAGRLLSVADPFSSYSYSYDAADRLLAVDNLGTPGVPRTVLTFSYDGFSNRTGLSDDRGGSISSSFDAAHRLTGLSLVVSGEQGPQVTLGYDGLARLTGMTRQVSASGPSLSSSLTYDSAHRLTALAHTSSVAGGLASFSYGYDNASQLVSATGPEGSRSYSYDGTGQLTGVTGAHPETYSYDDNGNRTLAGYAVGPGNRLSSDGTYEYTGDDEGNIVTKTRVADGARTEFTWDHRQRLTQVLVYDQWGTLLQEERFTYDALDRRIGVWVDADGSGSEAGVQTWTVYDGANPYADFDGSGALTYRYLYGQALDQLFARVDAAGSNTVWHLSDRLGSVRQLVTPDGTVLDALTYDSYGNILDETNPENGDRFKYTGREYDPILGMYYYRARYYAPGIGSFTSEDPLGFAGGDTNPYRYVHNRPTNAIDPTGRDEELVPAGPVAVARTDTGAIGAIGVAPPAGSSLGGTLGSCLGGAAGGAVTGAGTGAVIGGISALTGIGGLLVPVTVLGGTIGGALVGCAVGIYSAPPTTTFQEGFVEGVPGGLIGGVPGGAIGSIALGTLAGSAPSSSPPTWPFPGQPPGGIFIEIIEVEIPGPEFPRIWQPNPVGPEIPPPPPPPPGFPRIFLPPE
jgi:RHS repeat-associated protein